MPLLANVPLTMPLREQSDAGVPLVAADPDDPAAAGDPPRGARADRARAAAPRRARAEPVGMALPMAG